MELRRLVAVFANAALFLAVVLAIEPDGPARWWLAAALVGPVLLLAGAVAAGVAALAKWALVGRVQERDYPLWEPLRVAQSSLADSFTEILAAPWLARGHGDPGPQRMRPRRADREGVSGARPTGCRSPTWSVRDGATVNHGCVVQTHPSMTANSSSAG